jgi:hypothetical protein
MQLDHGKFPKFCAIRCFKARGPVSGQRSEGDLFRLAPSGSVDLSRKKARSAIGRACHELVFNRLSVDTVGNQDRRVSFKCQIQNATALIAGGISRESLVNARISATAPDEFMGDAVFGQVLAQPWAVGSPIKGRRSIHKNPPNPILAASPVWPGHRLAASRPLTSRI